MIEGLILGGVTWLSLVLTWWHLPNPFKTFTRKHPVISDVAASALTYLTLSSISKSLVAAVAAIFCGLLINFTIMGANLADETHKTN